MLNAAGSRQRATTQSEPLTVTHAEFVGPMPSTVGPLRVATGDGLNTPGTNAQPLALTATALGAGGIRINWEDMSLSPDAQIVVFRKALEETNWPQLAIGEPAYNATSFTDATAAIGSRYEYRVLVYAELGGGAIEKFILAGNQAAPVTGRGSVLLVVDETQLDSSRDVDQTSLAPALARYKADLMGEGYRVLTMTAPRVDVPRSPPSNQDPSTVAAHFASWSSEVMTLKQRIRDVWAANADLKTVVLLGHVAVPYSGILNPDGSSHVEANGAWAADAFYSVLSAPDSLWTDVATAGEGSGTNVNLPGDGKFDQDTLFEVGYGTPYEGQVFADVAIGRIDFATLSYHKDVAVSAGVKATPGETKLLANYLARNHAWRTGDVSVQRKALFEEQFPFPEYYDTNLLVPNVGFGGVVAGTTSPNEVLGSDEPFPSNVPAANSHDLATQRWLWLYASAGGYPTKQTIHFSPNRQLRSDMYVNGAESSVHDIYKNNNFGPHNAVFNLIYGSYVGDWDGPNGLLRSIIAEVDGLGLTSAWGARPNWEQHHMGLGEPIGTSLEKTINSIGVREAYGYDAYQGSVRLALMGDPTLREANVRPASNVRTAPASGGTTVTWTASADPSIAGYYLYRATTPSGPFVPVDGVLRTGTTFTDTTPAHGAAYYMVRAARLETVPSGSYWNLATGAVSRPKVTASSFSAAFSGHAIDVTFDQNVGASLDVHDFTITGTRYNFATHSNVPAALVPGFDFELASYNPVTRTARLIFHVGTVPSTAGQIPSGRYTLAFQTDGVANAFLSTVDAAYSFQFGYLAGDTNGDLDVDFDDLLILAQRFGQSTGGLGVAAGDLNGDGVVNFDDLLLLAKSYNVSL